MPNCAEYAKVADMTGDELELLPLTSSAETDLRGVVSKCEFLKTYTLALLRRWTGAYGRCEGVGPVSCEDDATTNGCCTCEVNLDSVVNE